MHDELQVLARAQRRFAEDGADVEHAQAAHLEEILEQGGAAPLDRFGPDAVELDHVVGDEPAAAAHQFQRELALAHAGVAR